MLQIYTDLKIECKNIDVNHYNSAISVKLVFLFFLIRVDL